MTRPPLCTSTASWSRPSRKSAARQAREEPHALRIGEFCLEQAGSSRPMSTWWRFLRSHQHHGKGPLALRQALLPTRRIARWMRSCSATAATSVTTSASSGLQQLGFDLKKIKIQPVEHHLAHASSAYHCSGFKEKTAILGIDGSGRVRHHLLRLVWRTVGSTRSAEFYDPIAGRPVRRDHRVPRLRHARRRVQGHGAWRSTVTPASTISPVSPSSRTANW